MRIGNYGRSTDRDDVAALLVRSCLTCARQFAEDPEELGNAWRWVCRAFDATFHMRDLRDVHQLRAAIYFTQGCLYRNADWHASACECFRLVLAESEALSGEAYESVKDLAPAAGEFVEAYDRETPPPEERAHENPAGATEGVNRLRDLRERVPPVAVSPGGIDHWERARLGLGSPPLSKLTYKILEALPWALLIGLGFFLRWAANREGGPEAVAEAIVLVLIVVGVPAYVAYLVWGRISEHREDKAKRAREEAENKRRELAGAFEEAEQELVRHMAATWMVLFDAEMAEEMYAAADLGKQRPWLSPMLARAWDATLCDGTGMAAVLEVYSLAVASVQDQKGCDRKTAIDLYFRVARRHREHFGTSLYGELLEADTVDQPSSPPLRYHPVSLAQTSAGLAIGIAESEGLGADLNGRRVKPEDLYRHLRACLPFGWQTVAARASAKVRVPPVPVSSGRTESRFVEIQAYQLVNAPCPTCGGGGRRLVPDFLSPGNRWSTATRPSGCRTCGGRGVVTQAPGDPRQKVHRSPCSECHGRGKGCLRCGGSGTVICVEKLGGG